MAKKLLLADDSLTIQKVVGIVFANLDYQLLVADNGDAALEMARKEFPDLIIADVSMPGKDGLELCRELKADDGLAAIPVLLLPGVFENFDAAKAEEAGASGWLSKPFESQVLIDKVEECLAAAVDRVAAPTPRPAHGANEEAPAKPAVEPIAEESSGLEGGDLDKPFSEEQNTVGDDIWDAVTFEEEDLQADSSEPFESEPAAPADEASIQFEEPTPEIETTSTLIEEETEEEIPETVEDDLHALEDDLIIEEPSDKSETEAVISESGAEEDDEIFELAEDDILELEDDAIIEDVSDNVEPEPASRFEEEPQMSDTAEPAPVDFSAPVSDSFEAEPVEMIEPAENATETEPEPVAAARITPEPLAASDVPADVKQVEEQLRGLDSAELEAVIRKVAGPLVEKLAAQMLEQVVWEVVPDLAESMIRDEIRKIKEGAA